MDEMLNVINEISLTIWDDSTEITLIREEARGLPKACTTIWPLLAIFKKRLS